MATNTCQEPIEALSKGSRLAGSTRQSLLLLLLLLLLLKLLDGAVIVFRDGGEDCWEGDRGVVLGRHFQEGFF